MATKPRTPFSIYLSSCRTQGRMQNVKPQLLKLWKSFRIKYKITKEISAMRSPMKDQHKADSYLGSSRLVHNSIPLLSSKMWTVKFIVSRFRVRIRRHDIWVHSTSVWEEPNLNPTLTKKLSSCDKVCSAEVKIQSWSSCWRIKTDFAKLLGLIVSKICKGLQVQGNYSVAFYVVIHHDLKGRRSKNCTWCSKSLFQIPSKTKV